MNNNYNKYFTETDAGLNIEANNINANCITSQTNKFSLDSEGNLICNSVTTVANNQALNFDSIYPIGSIYMSVNDVNPGTLFEGTSWEKITDRFLVGAGSTYPLNSTGGTVDHEHTSASHTHNAGNLYAAVNFAGTYGTRYLTKTGVWFTPNERKADGGAGYGYTSGCNEGVQVLGEAGWTTPGNTGRSSNIPPYLAINIWKRIS